MRLLSLLFLITTPTIASERPNVPFLIADDLRPEFGCYGVEAVKTPHVDEFAKSALVFEAAHCQQAVCMASRMRMLTGLRPAERRIWTNNDVRENVQDIDLFPGHFHNEGYTTVGIGKINHNSRESDRGPRERGVGAIGKSTSCTDGTVSSAPGLKSHSPEC